MSDVAEVQEKTLIEHNKGVLLEAMRALGLEEATIEYSGGGDSGQVDAVSVEPMSAEALGSMVTLRFEASSYLLAESRWERRSEDRCVTLEDALSDFANQVIYAHAPGFENNEGGCGTLTLRTESGKWTLDHTTYYTQESSESFEG